jgi:hypothetical protein
MKMVALAALAAVSMLGLAQPARAGDRCDRACLEGFADRYVAAMVAHDPSRLPWAARARFTENGQELRIGDALWGTASAAGKYRLYVADPEMGQIGFYGTLFENGAPVLLALRLKIENQVISEAETIVARPTRGSPFANAGETLEKKGAPRPQFLRTVPARERLSREDLVKAADSYFTGLAANDGKNTAAFAPTCLRWENGTQTNSNPTLMPARPGSLNFVAMGCEEQQKSGYFAFVTEIRNRRYPVVRSFGPRARYPPHHRSDRPGRRHRTHGMGDFGDLPGGCQGPARPDRGGAERRALRNDLGRVGQEVTEHPPRHGEGDRDAKRRGGGGSRQAIRWWQGPPPRAGEDIYSTGGRNDSISAAFTLVGVAAMIASWRAIIASRHSPWVMT